MNDRNGQEADVEAIPSRRGVGLLAGPTSLLRRVLLPALLAAPFALAAFNRADGFGSLWDLFADLGRFLSAWGAFAVLNSIGLIVAILPIASLLLHMRVKGAAAVCILLTAGAAGGAAFALLLFGPGLLSSDGVSLLSGLGALAGLLATLAWLLLNGDVGRSSRET
jgi:hypothetical protein